LADKELSDDFIDNLLNEPKRGSGQSYSLPGTNKRIKYDPSVRTVSNWFKLPHTMNGQCDVPNHDEEREARNKPRMFFIPEYGPQMCRWCFVEERDKL
jgi:hypothetical protein